MKDEHTYGKKMARNGRTKVIYKGTFVSIQSLLIESEKTSKIKPPLIRSHVYIGGPFCCSFIPVIINAIKEIKEMKQNQVRPFGEM